VYIQLSNSATDKYHILPEIISVGLGGIFVVLFLEKQPGQILNHPLRQGIAGHKV
jgi:hypothetical protein